MTEAVRRIVEKLELVPHPEGGFFKEVYRSEELIPKEGLAERFPDSRSVSTSIYYLLDGENISHFHKIKSDEIWHFYSGTTLLLHQIDSEGNSSCVRVGSNLENGEVPQAVVMNGNWFAAEVEDKNSYTLVGCTVAPGFDFSDFELAVQKDLRYRFPQHADLIKMFTAN